MRNYLKRINQVRPAKETLAQMFSCEFCESYKNTFIYRTYEVDDDRQFVLGRFEDYCNKPLQHVGIAIKFIATATRRSREIKIPL